MNRVSTEPTVPSPGETPRRRPRYGGKHPRRFEEKYKELNPGAFPEMQEHIRAQGRTPAGTHVPIMLKEVLQTLAPQRGEIVVDGTVGWGGHALAFLEQIGPEGRLIGLDLDAEQLARTAARFSNDRDNLEARSLPAPGVWRPRANVSFHHMHFAGIPKALSAEGLGACDVLFADLGVSSMQLDDPARGFSYKHDGPLDMRMNSGLRRTAAELLATASEEELAGALDRFSDEPDHAAIARRIVTRRETIPLRRTKELVRLIFEAKGIDYKEWKKSRREGETLLHPAARAFQALRILVNDELRGLEQLLRVAPYCLRPGGRVGILSFHSGEHERVVQALEIGVESGLYSARNIEPIRPSAEEKMANPRSRSAFLQWARRSEDL